MLQGQATAPLWEVRVGWGGPCSHSAHRGGLPMLPLVVVVVVVVKGGGGLTHVPLHGSGATFHGVLCEQMTPQAAFSATVSRSALSDTTKSSLLGVSHGSPRA